MLENRGKHWLGETSRWILRSITLLLLVGLVPFLSGCGESDDVFVLESGQSMLITGKGPGQDAAINPFSGQACLANVENLSANSFTVRIEEPSGRRTVEVGGGRTERVSLGPESQLLLDTTVKSKARIQFEKLPEVAE